MIKEEISRKVPTTRYQGSKRRILPWLYENLRHLNFKTVLDGFGGTASVSYLFKMMEKKVTFNDILYSNYMTAIALIENDSIKLDEEDLKFILEKNGYDYPSFISDTFKGIYYRKKENQWLDMVSINIKMLSDKYYGNTLKIKKALAYHNLFQACLRKRPFNLFHRKNLYLRTSKVERSFGNKKTWETKFKTLFLNFNKEITQKIFSTKYKHRAFCEDIIKIKNKSFDLVYLDPPYARPDEKKPKDYHSFYHFLQGLIDYDNWPDKIDWNTKNRCLIRKKTEWEKESLENNFDKVIEKFRDSIIVISYGDPGYPSIKIIKNILKQYKSKVKIIKKPYNYKLNHKNGTGLYEVLIIGQ